MTPESEKVLVDSAIDPDEARALGVSEAATVEELPDFARSYGGRILPALTFPWRSVDGREVIQVRPHEPVVNRRTGRPMKYLWPAGEESILNVLKPVSNPSMVLLVEGTKQTLAALRYAPSDWQVVGVGGCSTWTTDGVPAGSLADLVDGIPVVVLFDADICKNLEVWTSAQTLGEAVEVLGATEVRHALVPGRGQTGLDDFLAALPEDKRAAALERLVKGAGTKLPAKPKPSKTTEAIDWIRLRETDRPVVDVTSDRLPLGKFVGETLVGKWGGSRLFDYGRSFVSVQGGQAVEVDRDAFTHLVYSAVRPQREDEYGNLTDAELSQQTLAIARDVCLRSLPALDSIATTPFIRDDGTVCAAEGYDSESGVLLVGGVDLSRILVPDNPTAQDAERAAKFLMHEWLGDFPYKTQADRANLIGLALTPFIRHLVALVPICVVNGQEAGVGKGLATDCLFLMFLGRHSDPTLLPTGRTEMWKTLHATARGGGSFVFLDEAHVLEGDALASAVTAPAIFARVLGESRSDGPPNRLTWIAAGNNVVVRGDLFRRVYQVRLAPQGEGWHARPSSSFRHPDLRRWTLAHREELMSAALTILRAWYAAGCPEPQEQPDGFGSFEQWQHIVAGALEHAGVDGFLGNLKDFRRDAATDRTAWADHLRDLVREFPGDGGGSRKFTVKDVRLGIVKESIGDIIGELDPDGPTPDRLTEYGRALGRVYRQRVGQMVGGLTLLKYEDHGAQRGVAYWRVEAAPPSGGSGGSGGSDAEAHEGGLHTPPAHSKPHEEEADANPPKPPDPPKVGIGIDFETADADQAYTGAHDGPFLRVMAWSRDAASGSTSDPEEMRRILNDAAHLYTSGGYRFDLPAAAYHLDLDPVELVMKADDTEVSGRLANPPRKARGADRDRYDLGHMAQNILSERKDDALPRLRREYGGYDKIPVDHPEYAAYAERDAGLSLRAGHAISVPDPAYRDRERRVGALAASLTVRGVRVDTPLLRERIADVEADAVRIRRELQGYGFPAAAAPTSAPWATHAAGSVLDELAGRRWPRAADGKTPLTNREYLEDCRDGLPSDARAAVDLILEASRTGSPFLRQLARSLSPDGWARPHYRIAGGEDGGATGRWSTSHPNILGVGKRGELLLRERDVIIAQPGEVFISVDLAGIDARAVAGLSGDGEYLALMAPGIDIHLEIAEVFFGERSVAARAQIKPYTHGVPYGRSARTLAKDIVKRPGRFHGRGWEEVVPEMQLSLDAYYARFPLILDWQTLVRAQAVGGGLLNNGFGRLLRTQPDWEHTQAPSRQAQSCARDLAMEGLFRIQDAGLWPRVRIFAHDEVVLSVPEDRAVEIGERVAALMSFDWRSPSGHTVPIIAKFDGKYGPRWSDAYRNMPQ